ncbi:hypothetical protein WN943_004820 [Citrus x changshan-huyou]
MVLRFGDVGCGGSSGGKGNVKHVESVIFLEIAFVKLRLQKLLLTCGIYAPGFTAVSCALMVLVRTTGFLVVKNGLMCVSRFVEEASSLIVNSTSLLDSVIFICLKDTCFKRRIGLLFL